MIEFAVLAIIGSLAVADVLLIGLDAGAKVVAGSLKTGLRGRRGEFFMGVGSFRIGVVVLIMGAVGVLRWP